MRELTIDQVGLVTGGVAAFMALPEGWRPSHDVHIGNLLPGFTAPNLTSLVSSGFALGATPVLPPEGGS